MVPTSLLGKVCLVTGAGQGIGKAITQAYQAAGATVVATDIAPQRPPPADHPMIVLSLDAADAEQAEHAARLYQNIDVLVNCAGFVAVGNALECTPRDFDASVAANMRSVYTMVRAFLPSMIDRGSGLIINIASVVSTTKAAANRYIYSATKAAVLAMTRSIALDFAGRGIRCNSISPGTVDTPSLQQRIAAAPDAAAAREALVRRQLLGRVGRPEEVAAVALLLASDQARFMTGSDIVIDGGMSL